MARLRSLGLIALLFSSVATAQSQGSVRVWTGAGYDSNVRRDYIKDGCQAQAAGDAVVSAVASVEGRVEGPRALLAGSYDLGGRKFFSLPGEDVAIQSATAGAAFSPLPGVVIGLDGRGKDRRGARTRNYSDLAADGYLSWSPSPGFELRGHAGAERFVYWDQLGYSFGTPSFGATARARLTRRQSLVAFGDYQPRRYQSQVHLPSVGQGLSCSEVPPDEDPNAPPRPQRRDNVLSAGLGYSYRGPFTLSLTYTFTEQASNSLGETVLRHRLALTGGVRLFWRITLLAQLAAQLAHYPDGFAVGEGLNTLEDEESHNSASLKVARPLSEHVDLELRYAVYQDRLPQNGFGYLRQVGWLGVTWRL